MVLMLALVLFKVGVLQTSEGEALRVEGARQWTRSRDVQADRGTIFDRNGEELAVSIAATCISVNPKLITDPDGTVRTLDHVLGLTDEKRQDLLAALVAKDRVRVRQASGRRRGRGPDRGTRADGRQRRPREQARPARWRDRSQRDRATDIDGVGVAGLELQYDDVLTGTEGRLEREVAPEGRSIPGSEQSRCHRSPVTTSSSPSTVRSSSQSSRRCSVASASSAPGGTGVVMDTDTGEVWRWHRSVATTTLVSSRSRPATSLLSTPTSRARSPR